MSKIDKTALRINLFFITLFLAVRFISYQSKILLGSVFFLSQVLILLGANILNLNNYITLFSVSVLTLSFASSGVGNIFDKLAHSEANRHKIHDFQRCLSDISVIFALLVFVLILPLIFTAHNYLYYASLAILGLTISTSYRNFF